MKNPITELLEVDLARLGVAGWVLLLTAVSLVIWGVFLIADDEEGLHRWQAFLCLLGGAVVFVGGRAALRAVGHDIYRTPSVPKDGEGGVRGNAPSPRE